MLAARFDAIVLGVGGMGSSTVYQLARRGHRVLGLERYDVPHAMGSSHGHTRIIRLAYYEDPSYVMLLQRSYELWRQLEGRAGERLLHVTGSVDAGPPDSWVFKGSLRSCLEHDLPHEVLTSKDLTRRYPGYRLPRETLAVLQPQGGFLLPERCVVAYVNAALAEGAEVHGRERVLDWHPAGDGVRVVTDRATYEADRLVVTAGAWSAKLLPFLDGLAVPERQVLAWLQPQRPELFTPDRLPVFNLLVDEGRFYGFPVFGIPGFKFGKYHHFEETGDPDLLEREPRPDDERILREFAARYFPDGSGPTMSLVACLFTNSPDNHFIIDTHPDHPQVSFASPCSGHGFKFASVMGEVMADLAERGTTRHNIELFRLDRLLGRERTRPDRDRRRLGAPARALPAPVTGPGTRPGARPGARPPGVDGSGPPRPAERPLERRGRGTDDHAGTISERSADAIRTFW
jgi:sarcosine oxidase